MTDLGQPGWILTPSSFPMVQTLERWRNIPLPPSVADRGKCRTCYLWGSRDREWKQDPWFLDFGDRQTLDGLGEAVYIAVKTSGSGSHGPGWRPPSVTYYLFDIGHVISLAEPQFPCLWNDDNSTASQGFSAVLWNSIDKSLNTVIGY